MNPLYQMLSSGQMMSGNMPQTLPQAPAQMQPPMNPLATIMQAMNNPAAFVKQKFPDIPANIENDPVQILSYLQQTRGITDQQIQQLYGMYGRR